MAAKFLEIFEEYALDNIMYLVDQNMLTRLNEFYGVGALPDFAEKTLGRITNISYPSLALAPFRGSSVEGESYVENEISFEALVRIVDTDAATVMRKSQKYARAFKTVIRGGTQADWVRNIPSPEIMPIDVRISWEYGVPAKNPNKTDVWFRDIDFELTFTFSER